MFEKFVGKKRNETNVFQLCCEKGITLVGRTLKVTLKWLQGCQEHKLNDQELLRAN
jgi:hypothetical protein